MPHIHLETTADLFENANVPDILEALVGELAGHDSVEPASIKAYHTLRSVWHMGPGAPPGFAHCTVMLMTGRDLELRQQIADGLLDVMKSHFSQSREGNEISITLEVREMERETYRKSL